MDRGIPRASRSIQVPRRGGGRRRLVCSPERPDCRSHQSHLLTLSRPLSRSICPIMGMREACKVAAGDRGKLGATPGARQSGA
jgi:hypothetical protein